MYQEHFDAYTRVSPPCDNSLGHEETYSHVAVRRYVGEVARSEVSHQGVSTTGSPECIKTPVRLVWLAAGTEAITDTTGRGWDSVSPASTTAGTLSPQSHLDRRPLALNKFHEADDLGLVSPFRRELRIASATPMRATPIRDVEAASLAPASDVSIAVPALLPASNMHWRYPALSKSAPIPSSQDRFVPSDTDGKRSSGYQLPPPPSLPLEACGLSVTTGGSVRLVHDKETHGGDAWQVNTAR